jgi:glycosyltransferase involved in cell wall biosynthesis
MKYFATGLLTDGPHHRESRSFSKPKMKLLVLAQTPPPVHGQSLAVQNLLNFLQLQPGWKVHHVELRLSRAVGDIGRWRAAKIISILRACGQTLGLFSRHGSLMIYYVPAPGKRGALYRDWLIMAFCRPFSRGLILHWHAVGLGSWLRQSATAPERWLTRLLLGRAALAIIQTENGREDAATLGAQRCVVVPNGAPPVVGGKSRDQFSSDRLEVLFVGLGCAEKGLFDALEGVRLANAHGLACRLTAIGAFIDPITREKWAQAAGDPTGLARHLGFVSEAERDRLLCAADVFCFPSYYPHEGQPSVLLEALAHDLPIVTTRWRGIPENMPAQHVQLVSPRDPAGIAAALAAIHAAGPPHGLLREHHRRHFTKDIHHQRMLAALQSVAT